MAETKQADRVPSELCNTYSGGVVAGEAGHQQQISLIGCSSHEEDAEFGVNPKPTGDIKFHNRSTESLSLAAKIFGKAFGGFGVWCQLCAKLVPVDNSADVIDHITNIHVASISHTCKLCPYNSEDRKLVAKHVHLVHSPRSQAIVDDKERFHKEVLEKLQQCFIGDQVDIDEEEPGEVLAAGGVDGQFGLNEDLHEEYSGPMHQTKIPRQQTLEEAAISMKFEDGSGRKTPETSPKTPKTEIIQEEEKDMVQPGPIEGRHGDATAKPEIPGLHANIKRGSPQNVVPSNRHQKPMSKERVALLQHFRDFNGLLRCRKCGQGPYNTKEARKHLNATKHFSKKRKQPPNIIRPPSAGSGKLQDRSKKNPIGRQTIMIPAQPLKGKGRYGNFKSA